MNKLKDLRDHLLAAVPGLENNPERLLLFADDGSWSSSNGINLSSVYSYNASIVLTDFPGGPESVMLPLLQWVARHQNELLANPANRDKMTFEAEVLASDLVDLTIKLPLTERVIVTRGDDGQLHVHRPVEPSVAEELSDTLRGGEVVDAGGTTLARLPSMTI